MTSPSNDSSQSSASNGTAAIQTTDQTVAIQDMAFSPSSLTIKKGVKATWTNKDSVTHSVVADSSNNNDGLPTTDNFLDNGQSYSHTFTTAGTFSYHCGVHPSMTGTITVVE